MRPGNIQNKKIKGKKAMQEKQTIWMKEGKNVTLNKDG